VKNKTSLYIKKKTEVILTLLELDDVHESSWVVVVSTDLSVYLDTTFHADLDTFLSGEGVLKTITEDDGYWKTLSLLVWTSGWLRGPYTTHLAEVPMLWGIDTF